jgi:GT2 family glycosyltransferase
VSGELDRLDVTVVIPARNSARTIERCLRSVGKLGVLSSRIIVLNDHSTDATVDIARWCRADVVDVSGAGGLGRARNLAFEVCQTRYLAFLNSDCYPHADWVSTLYRSLVSTGAAVAGGRQRELRDGTLAERWKAVHLRQDLGDEPIDDPDFLSGGNLLIDLSRVGSIRFDENYSIAYEDVDFCRRLRYSGQRLVYRPAAVVWHDHRETMRSLPLKVWSYGAFSRSVGQGIGIPAALRAFVRMHRRPHDQIRSAIRTDLRRGSLSFLAVDVYLLAASLWLFLLSGRSMKTFDTAPPTTM